MSTLFRVPSPSSLEDPAGAVADATRPAVAPWWCSPAGIAIGFLLPMFCLVSFAIELNLQGLTARGTRFLDANYMALGIALIVVMALGGWLGQQVHSGDRHPALTGDVDRAALVVGAIALAAYVVWFRDYLVHPAALWSILTGARAPERADELIPGLTSLANGAPVFFSIFAWRLVMRRDRRIPLAMRAMCVVLAVMTAFRVYAWSERLALIEALLPVALMLSVQAARSRWLPWRLLVLFGPILALPVLLLYFGLAESVRSWTSDTYNGKIDFWDFVIGRMATYYYTSLNNGAGYLATQDWPTFRFEYTLSMLHTAPLSVGRTFSALVGSSGPTFDAFLRRYADLEFNNPSGFYTVIYDLGIPLGILYFAVAGFVSGALFRQYAAGSIAGAMFYPVLFISFLEVFRYPYLGSGRAFAWCVCALLVLLISYPGRYRQVAPAEAPVPDPAV